MFFVVADILVCFRFLCFFFCVCFFVFPHYFINFPVVLFSDLFFALTIAIFFFLCIIFVLCFVAMVVVLLLCPVFVLSPILVTETQRNTEGWKENWWDELKRTKKIKKSVFSQPDINVFLLLLLSFVAVAWH